LTFIFSTLVLDRTDVLKYLPRERGEERIDVVYIAVLYDKRGYAVGLCMYCVVGTILTIQKPISVCVFICNNL